MEIGLSPIGLWLPRNVTLGNMEKVGGFWASETVPTPPFVRKSLSPAADTIGATRAREIFTVGLLGHGGDGPPLGGRKRGNESPSI